ncbi:hypothetical protein KBC79_02870 [Candidatus Woesebacteria bacterium]|nr:hypothetical protein [Candidatus Woesebacteria bacterium]
MLTKSENLVSRIERYSPQLALEARIALAESQPTREDFNESFSINSGASNKSKKIEYSFAVTSFLHELLRFLELSSSVTPLIPEQLGTSIEIVLSLIGRLVYEAPDGFGVCERNPKEELAQFARLLLHAQLTATHVPVVVPVCPDMDQYVLRDGLGTVIPKALGAIATLKQYFAQSGIAPAITIHLADVEGFDPVILHNSRETTASHRAKTQITLQKTRQAINALGLHEVSALMMSDVFKQKDLDYLQLQDRTVRQLNNAPNVRTRKVIEGLLTERKRLGNFDHIREEDHYGIVTAELAGYAAYGEVIAGSAIILSPDALSATPAYQFSLQDKNKYSPVITVRSRPASKQ